MSAPSASPTPDPSRTPARSPRLARFAVDGPVVRSASGRLVTLPVREAMAVRDAATARDARIQPSLPVHEAA